MAFVENRATKVIGRDAEAERASVEASLATVRAELIGLEAEGKGGRFGDGVVACVARSFEANRAKLAAEEKVTASRSELAEVRSRGHYNPDAIRALEALVARAVAEVENCRNILLRQKSIKGIWIATTSL